MTRDGKKYGPYTDAQLKQFSESRQLLHTDLLWKEGMDAWKAAPAFPDLYPQAPQLQATANMLRAHATPQTTPWWITGGLTRFWHQLSNPAKAGILAGGVIGFFLFVLVLCVLPMNWRFGDMAGVFNKAEVSKATNDESHGFQRPEARNDGTTTVKGVFRSVSGQSGKVGFGVTFTSLPRIKLRESDDNSNFAFRHTLLVDVSYRYFTWRNTDNPGTGTISGEISWEATGTLGNPVPER
jgi:hypothetical protein